MHLTCFIQPIYEGVSYFTTILPTPLLYQHHSSNLTTPTKNSSHPGYRQLVHYPHHTTDTPATSSYISPPQAQRLGTPVIARYSTTHCSLVHDGLDGFIYRKPEVQTFLLIYYWYLVIFFCSIIVMKNNSLNLKVKTTNTVFSKWHEAFRKASLHYQVYYFFHQFLIFIDCFINLFLLIFLNYCFNWFFAISSVVYFLVASKQTSRLYWQDKHQKHFISLSNER